MASDTWRYPWTMYPDYLGPGTPEEAYGKKRAALTTNVPAATRNAVSVATGVTADNPALNRPNYPTELAQSQQNMPNGSIRVVTQDARYPGAPDVQAQPVQQASVPNAPDEGGGFNTVRLGGFATQPQMASGGGNAGAGLFSPELSTQLQDLHTRASSLLSSRSLVDNWRGRQLAKMRDRMMLSEAALANSRVGGMNAQANMLGAQSSALRAVNEVPLAVMGDTTTRRGQNIGRDVARMHDSTQRYGVDTTAATHRYSTDIGADTARYGAELTASTQRNATDLSRQIHASDILRAQQQYQAVESGDLGAVEDVTHAFGGQYPRIPPTGAFHFDPATGLGVHLPPGGGLPKFYTQKQMAEEADRERRNKVARDVYGK